MKNAVSGKPLSFAPDYAGALVRPSPNFGERCGGKPISMLILHFTGMKNAEAAERLLTDPQSEVSAHYLVRENGAVIQMAPEAKRAWHAGKSFWQGETDINSCSIGIEIVNAGDYPLRNGDAEHAFPPYPDAQIKGLIPLCRAIIAHYGIAPRYVLAHSDIAPERKIDPGERFPWGELAAAGIGLYVPPAPMREGQIVKLGDSGKAVEALQAMLALYGYNISVNGIFDRQTELAVTAFQRHFRPALVDGMADISTISTLRSLLSKL